MNADISRWTFSPDRCYEAVLEQQGRVRLDSDFNEFVAILQRLRERAARDLIGAHGVPRDGGGFAVSAAVDTSDPAVPQPRLSVSAGRMYVDGILCETGAEIAFPQAGVAAIGLPFEAGQRIDLVYLDVWRRHVSAVQDEHLLDPALGGVDTTTRLQTVFQVRVSTGQTATFDRCAAMLPAALTAESYGRLTTSLDEPPPSDNPCIVAPGGGYRGVENRLYRVQIVSGTGMSGATRARFAWSRDNAAVAYPILEFNMAKRQVRLAEPARDEVLALQQNDWVEVLGDETELAGQFGTPVQVDELDPRSGWVTFKPGPDFSGHAAESHPRIRRWDGAGDQGTGIEVADQPIELEDGIQVQFALDAGAQFHVGDYWFFAARTADRSVEPLSAAPPHGIVHAYAPLALVRWTLVNKSWSAQVLDCRPTFGPLTDQVSLRILGGDGQAAMPGDELCQALEVRVVNGAEPVPDAWVRFEIVDPPGGGTSAMLIPATTGRHLLDVQTDSDGVASCRWKLDDDGQQKPAHPCQRVAVARLGCDGKAIAPPLHFNADLSIAARVRNLSSCPGIADARTVQDALDELCAQLRQSGGCEVTVGKDGQFQTLGEALTKLLGSGQSTVCICLLPGAQQLDKLRIDGATLKTRPWIRIHGCGAELALNGDLELRNLAGIALEDLTVRAAGSRMQLLGCDEVLVRGCTLVGTSNTDGRSVLAVGGAREILIVENEIEALPTRFTDVDKLLAIDGDPELTQLFAALFKTPDDPAVSDAVRRAGAVIQKLTADRVQRMVTVMQKNAAALKSPSDVTAWVDAFATAVTAQAWNGGCEGAPPMRIARLLERLHRVLSRASAGTALILCDAYARTYAAANQLLGTVSLYGPPTTGWLAQGQEKNLRARGPQIGGRAWQTLQLHGNEIVRLAVSAATVAGLAKLAESAAAPVDDVFQWLDARDNRFYDDQNRFVARNITLTANHFQTAERAEPGTAVGNTAYYLSNTVERRESAFRNAATESNNSNVVTGVPPAVVPRPICSLVNSMAIIDT